MCSVHHWPGAAAACRWRMRRRTTQHAAAEQPCPWPSPPVPEFPEPAAVRSQSYVLDPTARKSISWLPGYGGDAYASLAFLLPDIQLKLISATYRMIWGIVFVSVSRCERFLLVQAVRDAIKPAATVPPIAEARCTRQPSPSQRRVDCCDGIV